jgi:hypothetical protein
LTAALVVAVMLAASPPRDEPANSPAQMACVEAILPDLEAAVAAGLPTPAAERLLDRTGNAAIDAALRRCFPTARVSDGRRSFLLTYLFAEAGRRALGTALGEAG